MAGQPELSREWSKLLVDASADEKLTQRLHERPLSVLKDYGIPVQAGIEAEELGEDELARAVGGMKWDRNYVSSDVIDARGGQIQILGLTFTLDVNGKISSIS